MNDFSGVVGDGRGLLELGLSDDDGAGIGRPPGGAAMVGRTLYENISHITYMRVKLQCYIGASNSRKFD